jgi:hypothetical protein
MKSLSTNKKKQSKSATRFQAKTKTFLNACQTVGKAKVKQKNVHSKRTNISVQYYLWCYSSDLILENKAETCLAERFVVPLEERWFIEWFLAALSIEIHQQLARPRSSLEQSRSKHSRHR